MVLHFATWAVLQLRLEENCKNLEINFAKTVQLECCPLESRRIEKSILLKQPARMLSFRVMSKDLHGEMEKPTCTVFGDDGFST